MDGGAWKAAVHGVTGGRTRLSDFTFTFTLEEISVVFFMVLVAFVAFQSIFSEVSRSSSHFKRIQLIDRET